MQGINQGSIENRKPVKDQAHGEKQIQEGRQDHPPAEKDSR
jgi:hypothetical protein